MDRATSSGTPQIYTEHNRLLLLFQDIHHIYRLVVIVVVSMTHTHVSLSNNRFRCFGVVTYLGGRGK